jgi:hypothetical protein
MLGPRGSQQDSASSSAPYWDLLMLEQSKEFELDSTITASCEHTNESLGSIKGGNFLTT